MMCSVEPVARVTVPLPLMYWMIAFVSTVITNGDSTSTSSFVPGTIPPGQGASGTVEPQLPLPVAVISAARLVHPNCARVAMARAAMNIFVFITEWVVGSVWFKLSFLTAAFASDRKRDRQGSDR